MNIKELKEYLNSIGTEYDECEVICQKDSEGNYYSPLYCVDIDARYIPENTWSGIVYATKWTAEECCMDEAEYQTLINRPRCLVLSPTN